MPVYEYVCKACAKPFEELVRGDETVNCPTCHSTKVEKRFSTFATSNEHRSVGGATSNDDLPPGCGTCGDPRGPGACRMD